MRFARVRGKGSVRDTPGWSGSWPLKAATALRICFHWPPLALGPAIPSAAPGSACAVPVMRSSE